VIIAGIPAYNEEKTIARVILLAQKQVDIVVVCDDGSQDMTTEIAQRLGAVVIRHDRNRGYGAALQSLFEKARALNADMLVTLDADGQHDAKEIQALTQPIVEGKADVAIGSRFLNGTKSVPLYRRLGINFITKVTNGNSEERTLTDAQCGFRAYNRKAIESVNLTELGMGASIEILLQAKNESLKIAEVPVQTKYHGLDTSTNHPIKHGFDLISTIMRLVVEERPLVYLGVPGALLLLAGVSFGLWTLQLYSTEGRIVTNVFLASMAFTLIGIFVLFTAITLFAIIRQRERLERLERSREA